jgi:hypothetical protein
MLLLLLVVAMVVVAVVAGGEVLKLCKTFCVGCYSVVAKEGKKVQGGGAILTTLVDAKTGQPFPLFPVHCQSITSSIALAGDSAPNNANNSTCHPYISQYNV